VPSDNTTLQEVLRRFAAEGWDTDLWLVETGGAARLRCGRCGADSDPSELTVDVVRRMEGASDPADMLAVLGARCPRCQARGSMVVRYGPEADEAEAALLVRAVEGHSGEIDRMAPG
jgi:hypothetical protein